MLVVVAVAVALVLLLAIPLEVAFQLDRVEALGGHVSFRWLLGLVRVRFAIPRVRRAPREPAAEPAAGGERKRRAAGVRAARGLAVLRQAAFRERLLRFAGDLVHAMHVSRLRLAVRLGLGDPADTGCLWGLFGPLSAALGGLRSAEVRIEPEFIEPVLELRARGRVRVIPFRILALACCFALSPPSMRAWRTLRGGHA